MEKGKLYICPTPIGNLEDMTLRGIRILEEVDLVAAEDTRRSINLLNHFEIKNTLISYHEHNKLERGEELISKMNKGKNIALISDAGMPGISDPGEDLIRQAIDSDIEVIVLPGATASITALISSGLPTEKFVFEGFLPSRRKDRQKRLEELKVEYRTLILYESPYRIKDTLKDLLDIFGDREVSLARELTKKYEEILRGQVSEVLVKLTDDKIKGEFVLVVDGSDKEDEENIEIDIREELEHFISLGYSKSKSVKEVSKKFDLPRNKVYDESLKL